MLGDHHQPGDTTLGDTTAEETWMMSLVKGSVMIFSRSGASFPLRMLKVATTRWVTWCRYPLTTSSGSRTSTDSQLKQSCTVAPAKALCGAARRHRVAPGEQPPATQIPSASTSSHRLNSLRSPACMRATMVLVTEVPMLEPMMMGMAERTSSTRDRETR